MADMTRSWIAAWSAAGMATQPVIRDMSQDDLPAARSLLAQLGYALSASELRRRYDAIKQAADHELIVAEEDDSILALCHVYARPALDKPPEAVVQALVVDRSQRGGGIGRLMMGAVEEWAAARGFTSVALASHVSRSAAHAFYEAIGYRGNATSHLFRKALVERSDATRLEGDPAN